MHHSTCDHPPRTWTTPHGTPNVPHSLLNGEGHVVGFKNCKFEKEVYFCSLLNVYWSTLCLSSSHVVLPPGKESQGSGQRCVVVMLDATFDEEEIGKKTEATFVDIKGMM